MGRPLSAYLDFLRFAGALMVLFGHTRQITMATSDPIWAWLPGLFAHQGVVIFFVVSGFLVGGKLTNGAVTPQFLRNYAIDRASRIYTVVIPAVLLTMAIVATLNAVYGYSYGILGKRTCSPGVMDALTGVFFLHEGISSGICGNGPFWSLVYEVYYYVFAALIAGALLLRGRGRLICGAGVVLGLIYGLTEPTGMLWYGSLWFLGAAAAQKSWGRRQYIIAALAIASVVAMPILNGRESVERWDALLALIIAGSLVVVRGVRREPPGWLRAFVGWGAGFSFSLYMTHAPVIAALRTVLGINPTTPFQLWAYATTIVTALVVAYLFHLAFERHTGRVRAWMKGEGRARLAPSHG